MKRSTHVKSEALRLATTRIVTEQSAGRITPDQGWLLNALATELDRVGQESNFAYALVKVLSGE